MRTDAPLHGWKRLKVRESLRTGCAQASCVSLCLAKDGQAFGAAGTDRRSARCAASVFTDRGRFVFAMPSL